MLIGWVIVVGVVGLEVLRGMMERASREASEVVVALNLQAVGEIAAHAPQLTCSACGQAAPPGTRYCARCGAALRAGV